MKRQDFLNVGVREDCIEEAVQCVKTAAKESRFRGVRPRKLVKDVVNDPASFVNDPHFSSLANKMLIQEEPLPVKEPINYNLWGDVDQATLEQMQVACELPVAVSAALMPDNHHGYGLAIGGVLACDNAVIPYGVGVDIACFTGDTEIPLLDGKQHRIKDLADNGETVFVWSCLEDGKIVAAEGKAFKTRENTELVKVIIDDGHEIKCTPDEEFMLRDGSYRQAKDLQHGDSLMPFYSKLDKEGYVRIQQNYSSRWHRAHWVVARSGLLGDIPSYKGQRTILHHKDFQESNNLPNNLQFMGNKDHSSYHRSLVERNKYWQSEEFEKKRVEALSAKAKTPEGYAYYAERGSKNLKSYWAKDYDRAKANCAGNGERGKPFLIARNKSEEGRAKSREINNRLWTCKICGEQIRSHIGLYSHERSVHKMHPEHTTRKKTKNNHQVIAVEVLQETQDVYCLKVPKYENFAISAGVFVHNCRVKMSIIDIPVETLEKELQSGMRRGDRLSEAIENGTRFGIGARWQQRKEHPVLDMDWNVCQTTKALKDRAWEQLGTSGSGNHFVEIGTLDIPKNIVIPKSDQYGVLTDYMEVPSFQKGRYLAILSHSGSRGTGAAVCKEYSGIAKSRLDKRYKERFGNLAWLSMDSEAGQEYWAAMNLMGEYASANHAVIHRTVAQLLGATLVAGVENHHNFCWIENHNGREVFVHRKGATPASLGELGIIAGTMADSCYVVRGKGSHKSLMSCSHGAGRAMSRTEAKRRFNWPEWKKLLKQRGVRLLSAGIDEVPGAYKDIRKIMEEQKDLVDIIGEFTPRIVKMSDDGRSED